MSANVELRHLRYFIAVAEELHFSRAALRLHISQPPLSHQIQHLEDALQVRLLDRDKHHVELTPAGRVFLEHARSLVQGVEAARHAAVRAGEGGQRFRLAVSTVFDVRTTLRAARVLAARQPPIDLEFQTVPTSVQREGLLSDSFGAAIATPPPRGSGLGVIPLGRLEFAVLVAAAHPLARERRVTLASLGDEPLVLFPRALSPECHDQILGACEAGGYHPSQIHRVQGGLHVIAAMVHEGVGVAFWPLWVAETLNRTLRMIPFEPPGVSVEVGLIFREPLTPAVEALRDALGTLDPRTPRNGRPPRRKRAPGDPSVPSTQTSEGPRGAFRLRGRVE